MTRFTAGASSSVTRCAGSAGPTGLRIPRSRRSSARATVDVGAVIDFASSFGTLVLTRAYADWSDPVNAGYRGQLVSRAVDLVQLFPAAAYAKNGADIRLAVDAVEDMFRLSDLTPVVIVAGDSDYIAVAQRCRRLGRYVVGVGVAGSTSRSLAAACDELVTYDALPGIPPVDASPQPAAPTGSTPAEQQEPAAARPRAASGRPAAAGPTRPIPIPKTHKSWRPGSWNARYGSARKRTTPTGCTAPR